MIHQLQPGCLINNRMGGLGADYGTPEQVIPKGALATPFEVCQTMNGSWGYNREDHSWKNARTVVHQLADTAGKGGNYLLNVGPTPEGLIPEESASVLRQVGRWPRRTARRSTARRAVPTCAGSPISKWSRPGRANPTCTCSSGPKTSQIFYWDFRKKLKKAYLLADRIAAR